MQSISQWLLHQNVTCTCSSLIPITVSMVIRASDTFANLAATSAIDMQDTPLADTYHEDECKEDAAEADNMADAAAMLSKRSFRLRAHPSFSHG